MRWPSQLVLSTLLLLSLNTFANDNYYPAYFQSQIEKGSLVDLELKEELFRILSDYHNPNWDAPDSVGEKCQVDACYKHSPLSYKGARKILFGQIHLKKENEQYFVEDVYCSRWLGPNEFRSGKPGPGKIPNSQIVNAEHTWPQSKFSKNFSKDTQKSDLHALYPVYSRANSSRSNIPFGDVSRISSQMCPASKKGASNRGGRQVFEPPPEHKGNVARALFYFSIRYKMPIDDEQESFLRLWHILDPVDGFEFSRNEQVFAEQLNRNPFVDYEELPELISDF